jgi:hypothetical protein
LLAILTRGLQILYRVVSGGSRAALIGLGCGSARRRAGGVSIGLGQRRGPGRPGRRRGHRAMGGVRLGVGRACRTLGRTVDLALGASRR